MRAGVRMEDMMLRRVIEIEEEKCNGCGACANACHEGAISIVNGKAKLMRDDYCDGLGDCLPTCPMDAIHFVEREAAAYDAAAVEENKRKKAAQQAIASQPLPCGCPGTQAKTIRHEQQAVCPTAAEESAAQQFPVIRIFLNTGELRNQSGSASGVMQHSNQLFCLIRTIHANPPPSA